MRIERKLAKGLIAGLFFVLMSPFAIEALLACFDDEENIQVEINDHIIDQVRAIKGRTIDITSYPHHQTNLDDIKRRNTRLNLNSKDKNESQLIYSESVLETAYDLKDIITDRCGLGGSELSMEETIDSHMFSFLIAIRTVSNSVYRDIIVTAGNTVDCDDHMKWIENTRELYKLYYSLD